MTMFRITGPPQNNWNALELMALNSTNTKALWDMFVHAAIKNNNHYKIMRISFDLTSTYKICSRSCCESPWFLFFYSTEIKIRVP